MRPIGDINTVRARLLMRGWRSVAAWAEAHGYLPVTVRRTIYQWGERPQAPHGGVGRQIMADLQKTLSEREAA
ncbi:hypothetical protein [Thermomonas sp.]|uniref:hypothetical protein n=1 Tax=Thermomonas sp. TaxID=1971895 RepID=UPI003BF25801